MKKMQPAEWNQFYLKDVSFVNLMMRRIYNVLIADAQFPNVRDSREIENALNNLVNAAAQRANKR